MLKCTNCNIRNKEVVTIRGATIHKMVAFVNKNLLSIKKFKVIVLHVGTNYFSKKHEWFLYMDFVNGKCTREEYNCNLQYMNPPPAVGTAISFKESYQYLIDLLQRISVAKILLSAILPRFWDHDRRNLVRRIYNDIIQKLAVGDRVFYIPSYRPFFNGHGDIKSELYHRDGLYLSSLGTTVFSTYISDRVQRCIRGELK